MRKTTSSVSSSVIFGVLAASVTLFLGWPNRVNAVGEEEQAAQQQLEVAREAAAPTNAVLAKNESKIGDLDVTATLGTSVAKPGRQIIRLECHNPTEGRIAGKLQVALTRTNGNSMERVMPTPQIAWRQNEAVDIAAGETLVREIALPKIIGDEVARIEKARQKAGETDDALPPRVYFGVTAAALESAVTRRQGKNTNQVASMPLVHRMVPPGSKHSDGRDFGY